MSKRYPVEVKDRAVRMVLEHRDQYPSLRAACVGIGDQLGISRESLRRWVDQAQVDAGAKPGLSSAEAEELKTLKAENKRLREANEILRSALIFFARELDPSSVDRRLRRPDEGQGLRGRVDLRGAA